MLEVSQQLADITEQVLVAAKVGEGDPRLLQLRHHSLLLLHTGHNGVHWELSTVKGKGIKREINRYRYIF